MYLNNFSQDRRFPSVTLDDIKKARYICAFLIKRNSKNSRKLLPLFERLENEIRKREKETLLLDLALQVANDNSFKIIDTN